MSTIPGRRHRPYSLPRHRSLMSFYKPEPDGPLAGIDCHGLSAFVMHNDMPGCTELTKIEWALLDQAVVRPHDEVFETSATSAPAESYNRLAIDAASGLVEPLKLNNHHQHNSIIPFDASNHTIQMLPMDQQLPDLNVSRPLNTYYLPFNFPSFPQPPLAALPEFDTAQPGLHAYTSNAQSASPTSGSASPSSPWDRLPENKGGDGLSGFVSPSTDDAEDADGNPDKPYAKLIWEALMQAPGHRMVLRDIYLWFQKNTNKARDPGSNGWQNSIRHNLSMNQAFENDKSESAASRGQAKKASSMWVLTENAIRNGVQSTTRYRKTGSSKKPQGSKAPAPLRQRSGAKGGRAARRAARQRRIELGCPSDSVMFPSIGSPPDLYNLPVPHPSPDDHDYMSIHTPAALASDHSYGFSSTFGSGHPSNKSPVLYSLEEEFPENAMTGVLGVVL